MRNGRLIAGVAALLAVTSVLVTHDMSSAFRVSNRIAMLVMLLLMGFQGAAAPLFLSERDDPSTPGQIARIFRLFVALSLAMLLALS